jgi:hypothetical protein
VNKNSSTVHDDARQTDQHRGDQSKAEKSTRKGSLASASVLRQDAGVLETCVLRHVSTLEVDVDHVKLEHMVSALTARTTLKM